DRSIRVEPWRALERAVAWGGDGSFHGRGGFTSGGCDNRSQDNRRGRFCEPDGRPGKSVYVAHPARHNRSDGCEQRGALLLVVKTDTPIDSTPHLSGDPG